ncbi:MAG: hypothetical protein EBU46_04740 [Nitrosomonadaceae bacterium]|nr:hypothetical protein [Nitrosomonadaceae bacterium]
MAIINPEVDTIINEISDADIERYNAYWKTISPINDQQLFNRWVFAFLSVHTTWQANVFAYQQLTANPLPTEKEALVNLIANTKVGLVKMRSNGIHKFRNDFWTNVETWKKSEAETWTQFRNRTMEICNGIALAKTSFALELAYPLDCRVVCLDTHMLQLYKCDKKGSQVKQADYEAMEQHWLDRCNTRGVAPTIARNIYWDKVQKKPDTRYWTHVFETTTQLQQ